MKKIILAIILLLPVLAHAQKFYGGLQGGINATQVQGDLSSGFNKAGIVAGTWVQIDLTPKLWTGMELKYMQKGSRLNPNPKAGELRKYVMRLSYTELPVTIGWRAKNWFSVLAGISYNKLIHSREFDNYGDLPPQETLPFKGSNWDILAGGRFRVLPKLQFDIRYAYSLTAIRKLPGQSLVYIRDDQYSEAITTTLFYRIDW